MSEKRFQCDVLWARYGREWLPCREFAMNLLFKKCAVHKIISNALKTQDLISKYNVLSWRRKLSMDNDGLRRLSVREFQVIGPATEKARRPYVDLSNGDYVVPRTRLKFGDMAFSVAALEECNRLPTGLKMMRSTPAFKRSL